MVNTATNNTADTVTRLTVVFLILLVLVLVVYWALGWNPEGVLLDAKGAPVLDGTATIPKSRQASDVVAIIGAVTTFLGTLSGAFVGAAVGARGGTQAVAAADQANKAAQLANDSATQAAARSTSAEGRANAANAEAKAAIAAKQQQDLAIKPLLETLATSTPHVESADAALGKQLASDIASVQRTLR